MPWQCFERAGYTGYIRARLRGNQTCIYVGVSIIPGHYSSAEAHKLNEHVATGTGLANISGRVSYLRMDGSSMA